MDLRLEKRVAAPPGGRWGKGEVRPRVRTLVAARPSARSVAGGLGEERKSEVVTDTMDGPLGGAPEGFRAAQGFVALRG